MVVKRTSRQEKYNNIVLNYNFPQMGVKEPGLPAPSLEDVKDSEKKEFFNVENRNNE